LELQAARLADLEELIRGIDQLIGGPLAKRVPRTPPPGLPGRLL